jgi:hypothetical protein
MWVGLMQMNLYNLNCLTVVTIVGVFFPMFQVVAHHSVLASSNQVNQSTKYSSHFLDPNLRWYGNMKKTRYENKHIKLGNHYHAMFSIGSHPHEEAAHCLILFIQMVQVPLAAITRFLHWGTTNFSHVSWN